MNMLFVYQNNISVLYLLTKCKEAIRVQDFDGGVRRFREFLVYFQRTLDEVMKHADALLEEGILIDSTYLIGMLGELMEAQQENDLILLADYLELKVQPYLILLQDKLGNKLPAKYIENRFESNIENLRKRDERLATLLETEYRKLHLAKADLLEPIQTEWVTYTIEETQKGYKTLKVTRAGHSKYYHSNQDPREEGMAFARQYYHEEALEYHVLGAGLMHHVFGLTDQLSLALPIHVYEPDVVIIILNLMLYDFTHLFSTCLTLHYDPNLNHLFDEITQNPNGFVIHAPSIDNIAMDTMKERIHAFFIADSSFRNQKILLETNFKLNMQALANEESVSVEVEAQVWNKMEGKDVYLIAAGPSLDRNLEQLKERPGNSIIISTGTTFYKMLSLGIRPDYVIISDPNERVIYQLRGNEEETIPMILLATANRQFIQKYKGKKYLIFQKEYAPSEKYASEHKKRLFETGGSVATTALDFAIRAGARRIIFLGLDLAFTNNLAHAQDTSNMVASDPADLIPVKEYFGGKVLSDAKFIMYRKWMEKRIQKEDSLKIEIINATEGGSYVYGMKHIPLSTFLGRKQTGESHV